MSEDTENIVITSSTMTFYKMLPNTSLDSISLYIQVIRMCKYIIYFYACKLLLFNWYMYWSVLYFNCNNSI